MIDRVEERFSIKPQRLIGDTAYGSATMLLRDLQRGPFGAGVDLVDYRDGPLKWRANGGADFTIICLASSP